MTIHFAWQVQHLVKLHCVFAWQAQHFVTFWEIAGARSVRLQDRTRKVSDATGARRQFYRRIVVGSWSNRLSIGGSTSGSFSLKSCAQNFVAGAARGEFGK